MKPYFVGMTREPRRVQPKKADQGASIAIVDADGTILALIPPLNIHEDPDHDTAVRGENDEAVAVLMAHAPAMYKALLALNDWSAGSHGEDDPAFKASRAIIKEIQDETEGTG